MEFILGMLAGATLSFIMGCCLVAANASDEANEDGN